MATSIALSNVQIPAHLANRIGSQSVLTQSLAGGLSTGESFSRISIKGGRFRIIEDGVETLLDSMSLDVVVVGANPHLTKTFYAKQWTPDAEASAPDCFSHNGITPDASATTPQSDLCAKCPQNAWGSRVTPQGKEIKACSDQKTLAIVSADDADGSIYQLHVTPAALSNLSKYHKELSVRGIPAEIVRTKIAFDTDASFPKLTFSFNGFLDEATQGVVDGLFGSDEVKAITGESRIGNPVAIPVATKPVQAKPSVQVAAPAPVVEPAPVTKGFGKKVAPAVAPIEKTVEQVATPTTSSDVPSASSLADEIAALVGSVGADDE